MKATAEILYQSSILSKEEILHGETKEVKTQLIKYLEGIWEIGELTGDPIKGFSIICSDGFTTEIENEVEGLFEGIKPAYKTEETEIYSVSSYILFNPIGDPYYIITYRD